MVTCFAGVDPTVHGSRLPAGDRHGCAASSAGTQTENTDRGEGVEELFQETGANATLFTVLRFLSDGGCGEQTRWRKKLQ